MQVSDFLASIPSPILVFGHNQTTLFPTSNTKINDFHLPPICDVNSITNYDYYNNNNNQILPSLSEVLSYSSYLLSTNEKDFGLNNHNNNHNHNTTNNNNSTKAKAVPSHDPKAPPPKVAQSNKKEEIKSPKAVVNIQHIKCTFCGKEVYQSEMVRDGKENPFHSNCFKCAMCKKDLKGKTYKKHIDGNIYCDTAATGCFFKLQKRITVKGTDVKVEKSGQDIPDTTGILTSVLGSIGSELEKSVGGMVPRCSVCGGTLAASEEVVVNGQTRTHKACVGKPKNEAKAKQQLTVFQSANLVLNTLTARVFWYGKWFSFIFVSDPTKPKTLTNEIGIFEYLPDPKSRSPNSRPFDKKLANDEDKVNIEVTGEWKHFIGKDIAEINNENSLILKSFSHKTETVDWKLEVIFSFDMNKSNIAAKSALLTLKQSTLMPDISMPSMPDISMPSMPDISMPSMPFVSKNES
eukprot:c21040_g4_i1.p1 GENE.c21040_g4_i1~~c21040_g4_i1.p1  ORF type:complete len:464 (+),score=184.85 c21040_g4_i1:420-1811(+)